MKSNTSLGKKCKVILIFGFELIKATIFSAIPLKHCICTVPATNDCFLCVDFQIFYFNNFFFSFRVRQLKKKYKRAITFCRHCDRYSMDNSKQRYTHIQSVNNKYSEIFSTLFHSMHIKVHYVQFHVSCVLRVFGNNFVYFFFLGSICAARTFLNGADIKYQYQNNNQFLSRLFDPACISCNTLTTTATKISTTTKSDKYQ